MNPVSMASFADFAAAHEAARRRESPGADVREYSGAALWAVPHRLDVGTADESGDSCRIAIHNSGTVDIEDVRLSVIGGTWLSISTDRIPLLPHDGRDVPFWVKIDTRRIPEDSAAAWIELSYPLAGNRLGSLVVMVTGHIPLGPLIRPDDDVLDFSTASTDGSSAVKTVTLRNVGSSPADITLTPTPPMMGVERGPVWRTLRSMWPSLVMVAVAVVGIMIFWTWIRVEEGSCLNPLPKEDQEIRADLISAAQRAHSEDERDRVQTIASFVLKCESHTPEVSAAAEVRRGPGELHRR